MLDIYVDADACPVKDEVYRTARRCGLKVFVVSNSYCNVPMDVLFQLKIVHGGFDAADDWIVDNIAEDDIVVTADIPLAAHCLEKGAMVLSPRGKIFDEESIGTAMANREMNDQLRQMGEIFGGPPPMAKKNKSDFLCRLDEIIQRLRRVNGLTA